MSIIFKYATVTREDKTLRHAPFIPIHVKTDFGRTIEVIALIDSGADNTVVPKQLAELIGLNESDTDTETAGVGGNVKVKKSRMSFKIKGDHEQYNLSVPVLILQDSKADVPLLLGRQGFFEHFHITFKQDQEKIVLKKIKPAHVF